MASTFTKVYCAFCRLERKVCTKKTAGWTNVLSAALASLLIMFVVWQAIEPRAVIIFAVFLVVSEIFVRLRWRMSLPCPHCGFDPVLYKTDRQETVRRVKARLAIIRSRGTHLFKTQNPLENLPVVYQNKKHQEKVNSVGSANALAGKKSPAPSIISRQV